MIRYVATLMFAFSAVVLGDSMNDHEVNVRQVNGSVLVEEGREAGDVSTVNGSITLGRDARARDVRTVNGAIRLDDGANAASVETVNGSIRLGDRVRVEGGVSALNGGVMLQSGAQVGGRLANVNGSIELDGATVSGGIGTTSGDVLIGTGSRVDGGLRIEHADSSWFDHAVRRAPRITIESGAVLNGPLYFAREVDLHLGAGVVLGPVEGVEPRRHTIGGVRAGD